MNGLLKGLSLFLAFFQLKIKVVDQGGDETARADFDAVEVMWTMELANAQSLESALKAKKVPDAVLIAALMGKDPFSGSRKAFQQLQAKYK